MDKKIFEYNKGVCDPLQRQLRRCKARRERSEASFCFLIFNMQVSLKITLLFREFLLIIHLRRGCGFFQHLAGKLGPLTFGLIGIDAGPVIAGRRCLAGTLVKLSDLVFFFDL